MKKNTRICGIGRYLPKNVVSNSDIAKVADTSSSWIKQRIGVETRHFSDSTEHQHVMGARAALEALSMANVEPNEIDMILVTTNVPDYPIPSTACLIQRDIEATNAFATDLITACPGFPMALSMADAQLRTKSGGYVLIVATECLSKLTDPKDRTIYSILGDGAAAILLGYEECNGGLISSYSRTVGEHWDAIKIPMGGVINRPTPEGIKDLQHVIKMDGPRVKDLVMEYFPCAVDGALSMGGLSITDIDWMVPHQANINLMHAGADLIGLPREKVYSNIDRVGNTSSASIPLALYDLVSSGNLKLGQTILMPAFGCGFGYGAAAYKWC